MRTDIYSDYVSYKDIPAYLDIVPGEVIYIASDTRRLAYSASENNEKFDADIFINAIVERLNGGTLLFPVFNWDFCKGIPFDYKKTKGKTGLLGNAALKRSDFIRTKHPIYSFAVWGEDKEYLYGLDNCSGFGEGSIFEYLEKKNAKCITIDVGTNHSYTFLHYIENIMHVPYRYNKFFKSSYIDRDGKESIRTYSMYVRKLEYHAYEQEDYDRVLSGKLFSEGITKSQAVGGHTFSYTYMADSSDLIKKDISEKISALPYDAGYDHSLSGIEAFNICKNVYKINRSLAGENNRQTLAYIRDNQLGELSVNEYSCSEDGGRVFDWNTPPEWNIRDAFVEDEDGNRIIDMKNRFIHVVGYSEPVDITIPFKELDNHLYSLENAPDAIPYVTSYYKRRWGFCLPHSQREELRKKPEQIYHIKIDSDYNPDGVINYGELLIKGKTDDEILISTYICHPDMANDNLSGIAVTIEIAKYIYSLYERKFTYRIIFIPETIGSLIYLKRNLSILRKNIKAGFVLSCLGDEGDYSCIHTPYNNTYTDKVVSHVLKHTEGSVKEYSYLERGSDERQFCSPRAGLPVVCLTRTRFGMFKAYHTSEDDLDFISSKGLYGGINYVKNCIDIIENDEKYIIRTIGEPQLGKYGLYSTVSMKGSADGTRRMTNVIAYLDGKSSLLDIAEIINVKFSDVLNIVKLLREKSLVETI